MFTVKHNSLDSVFFAGNMGFLLDFITIRSKRGPVLGRLPIERQITEAHKEENLKDEGGLQDTISHRAAVSSISGYGLFFELLKGEKNQMHSQINHFHKILR